MNIPPDPTTKSPAEIARLNRAATRWLERHGRPTKWQKFLAQKRKERAARPYPRIHRI